MPIFQAGTTENKKLRAAILAAGLIQKPGSPPTPKAAAVLYEKVLALLDT